MSSADRSKGRAVRYYGWGRNLERGELMVVESGAGYGVAYGVAYSSLRGSIRLPVGTACVHLEPDEEQSSLRLQPMVRVLVDGQILVMDRRFLHSLEEPK